MVPHLFGWMKWVGWSGLVVALNSRGSTISRMPARHLNPSPRVGRVDAAGTALARWRAEVALSVAPSSSESSTTMVSTPTRPPRACAGPLLRRLLLLVAAITPMSGPAREKRTAKMDKKVEFL